MDPNPYSKRELDAAFDGVHDSITHMRTDLSSVLVRIETQASLTNGRVNKLEQWQAYVLGFVACLGVLIVPVFIAIIVKYLNV